MIARTTADTADWTKHLRTVLQEQGRDNGYPGFGVSRQACRLLGSGTVQNACKLVVTVLQNGAEDALGLDRLARRHPRYGRCTIPHAGTPSDGVARNYAALTSMP